MKRGFWLGCLLLLNTGVEPVASANTEKANARVEGLLAAMTIEEKVGQMTLLASYIFNQAEAGQPAKYNMALLREAIHTYKVGAFLNPPAEPFSPQQWHQWLSVIDAEIQKTEHKIPVLIGVDSIHGATFVKDATLLPHNIGIGATRNIDAAKLAAEITANETMATGVFWNFDPVLDLGRQPLWARFEETFAEDVHLVGQMGTTMVKTYEQKGMASTMKHFVGYGVPQNGKDRTPAYIADTDLWELHLKPFKQAVDAGASSVMINSGTVNNVPGHANHYLLKDVLREQWGFDGLVVTDWEDIAFFRTRHGLAASMQEAIKIGIEAGLDMSMVPNNFQFSKLLVKLVKSGEIKESRIDQSVRTILKFKQQLGLFDQPFPNTQYIDVFQQPIYQQQALDLANETMTLVKNQGQLLPLKANTQVLLAGPAAKSLGALHGSWSFSWQGDQPGRFPTDYQTIADAFRDYLGDDLTVMASDGFDSNLTFDQRKFTAAAAKSDVIVLALGESSYAEQPGYIHQLELPTSQMALAKAAITTGKPVVLVMVQGRPRIIEPIVEGSKAILLAYRPGKMGAKAIVQTLFGDNNPSGVLPFTYPRFSGDIMTYDHPVSAAVAQREMGKVTYDAFDPQWTFGHGLSYTQFAISPPILEKTQFGIGDPVRVTVKVKNVGNRFGKKAIDLYVRDHLASDSPVVKRLKRFAKLGLKPNEEQTVTFTLDQDDFSFINRQLKTVVEPGVFSIEVAGKTQQIELTAN